MESFATVSKKYREELEGAEVEFKYFFDIKSAFLKLNYRNHRKMTIGDNRILHTGRMDLEEEYITGDRRFDCWRNTNIRIEGYRDTYFAKLLLTGVEISYKKEFFHCKNIIADNVVVVIQGIMSKT